MFWQSHECFSILCNAFLLKSAISCHNSCGYNKTLIRLYKFNKKLLLQTISKYFCWWVICPFGLKSYSSLYLPNKHHAWFGTKIWMLACSKISYLGIWCSAFAFLRGCLIWHRHWTNQADLFRKEYDVIVQLMEMVVHTIVHNIYLLKFVNKQYPLYICHVAMTTSTMQ